jgi:5-(carboxyamino)imidazole ribonucleotide mutase
LSAARIALARIVAAHPHMPPANRPVSARRSRGAATPNPVVGVVMGSQSDYHHLGSACELLRTFGVPFETRIVSAHRTPDWLFEYAETAGERGLQVIIAGAGGAAHLPGMLAAKTIIPVLGVPVPATPLNGLDSLLSIVQMPKGVPVGTLAIGAPGAANAAILATEILALHDPRLGERLRAWRTARRDEVRSQVLPPPSDKRL